MGASISDPMAARTHFPLGEVCGRWVSLGGSPGVEIVFRGACYRVVFTYDPDHSYTCPVKQIWGITVFYLYGYIGLSYDAARGVLSLSAYGDYVREETPDTKTNNNE